MKPASLQDIKQELSTYPPKKIMELCLRLAKFKKENKELLSYLLFEAGNDQGYLESIRHEIDEQFLELPHSTWYITKKSLRKILRLISKASKHMANKEAETELLIHFCRKMKVLGDHYHYNQKYLNMYNGFVAKVRKLVETVHEDVQFDLRRQIEQL